MGRGRSHTCCGSLASLWKSDRIRCPESNRGPHGQAPAPVVHAVAPVAQTSVEMDGLFGDQADKAAGQTG